MFEIFVRGKAHHFATLEAAKEAARKIYERTGSIVGITYVEKRKKNPARHKPRAKRRRGVRGSRAMRPATRRRKSRAHRSGGRKTKHIRSRVVGAVWARPKKRATKKRAKASRRNPVSEFIVEAYIGGRRFAYYQDDKFLTTERGHASRFKNQYLARQKAIFVRDRAPSRVEWVRVAPA